MQELSVLNCIKRGVISPVYLLYGTEEYLQEMVINALKEALVAADIGAFNLDELEGEEVAIGTIVDIANTLPVFAEKRLVIVKNALEINISANEEKRLIDYLADPLPSTCLVFWQKGSVNKNRKIYKAIVANHGQVLALNELKGKDLNNWLSTEAKKKGKVLDPEAVDYLILNCGNNLRDLHNEVEKLSLYAGEERIITLAMAQKVTPQSGEGNIFTLVDSIGLRKVEKALQALGNLLLLGEPPGRIIYMIARQFRLILLVKDLKLRGVDDQKIAAELQIHPYVLRKLIQQTRNFSFAELERNLELIREKDLEMKSGFNRKLILEKLVIALNKKATGI